MEIKKTDKSDLEGILEIYESARQYMQEHGNPDQWKNGYPDENIILMDIENGNHYTLVNGVRLLGCFALIEGDDPTYSEILNGKWLDDSPYAAIHRLAVIEHGRGIGSICIDWCLVRFRNIRVDTHRDNSSMQRLLNKKEFKYCGVIYTLRGDERLAFQKVLI